jgi:hypothetical protein
MSTPLWALELAEAFWQSSSGPEPFPRTLRSAITRSGLDLTVKELAGLSVRRVERCLAECGANLTCGGQDRPLRAALVALRGVGFVFVDCDDPGDERTFSLAHELAHFLRDYWQPRRRATAALGEGALEVLDGQRPPTPSERLHALLRQAPIGTAVHLMERGTVALIPQISAAERDADCLACELLAPERSVREGLTSPCRGEVEALLVARFGLPAGIAAEHAAVLFPAPRPQPLLERLKKSLAARRTSARGREPSAGGASDERPI